MFFYLLHIYDCFYEDWQYMYPKGIQCIIINIIITIIIIIAELINQF